LLLRKSSFSASAVRLRHVKVNNRLFCQNKSIVTLCFNLFVIDSAPLIAKDGPQTIWPFWPKGPYARKNSKINLKITNFHISN